MKFGKLIPTLEGVDNTALESTEVTQDNQPDIEQPSGVDGDNIESNPNESEAQQAIDLDVSINQAQVDGEEVISQANQAIDYTNAAEKLDEIQQAANESVIDRGTLTKLEATSITASLESILSKIGMKPSVLPTLEAFNSTWSKKEATRVTLESLIDNAKNLGKKIIESIKALTSTVLNFLAGLVKNRALMEVNVKRLLNKLKQTDADKPREAELKGHYVSALTAEGEADFNSVMRVIYSSMILNLGFQHSVDTIKQIRDNRASDNPIKDLAVLIEDIFRDPVGKYSPSGDSDGFVNLYGSFVNGMSIAFTENQGKMHIHYVSNAPQGSVKPTSMPAPTKDEMEIALNKALELIRSLRKVEAQSSQLRDAVSGFIRRLELEYQTFRGVLGDDDYSKKAQLNKKARETQEVINKMIARFPSMIFSAVKHTCDWASAGINNLTKS